MKSKDLEKLVNTLFPNKTNNEIKNLNLNQLSILGKKNDIDLNDLKEFDNLETLSLRNFEINDDNVTHICKVKNLSLNNCVINLTKNTTSNIEYLTMINCNKIEHKLLNIDKIKKISLEDMNEISITEFLQYTNLTNLKIVNCKNITNIDNISKMTWLKDFSFKKYNNLPLE